MSRQSVGCWLDNTSRMGLLPVVGSCLSRKQTPGGLLHVVLQAVGWRLGTFSVAHRKPRTPRKWVHVFIMRLVGLRSI